LSYFAPAVANSRERHAEHNRSVPRRPGRAPPRINPLLWLPAVTLLIRALRERREGSPLRLPDRLFHDLGGSCAHIARHPPRSWKPGVQSRSNQRVNNLRAHMTRFGPGSWETRVPSRSKQRGGPYARANSPDHGGAACQRHCCSCGCPGSSVRPVAHCSAAHGSASARSAAACGNIRARTLAHTPGGGSRSSLRPCAMSRPCSSVSTHPIAAKPSASAMPAGW
jgi:hypothetical protein